jgi:hypothetical protein
MDIKTKMNRRSYKQFVIGGLFVGIGLVIIDSVIELLIWTNISSIGNELTRLASIPIIPKSAWSWWQHLINSLLPFITGLIIMFVYIQIRQNGSNKTRSILYTSLVFFLFWSVAIIIMGNWGIFPFRLGIISIVNNAIVIPAALSIGANYYDKVKRVK